MVNNYAGMDPSQIEGIITNVYEQNFQYVDGLKAIESKNIQNLVLLKLTFYPGTDMAAAMSQVVSLSNRARGQMPPSVLPPFVMRFDAANVPIGYLVLDSKTRPLGELTDLGMFRIRPLLIAQIPGTVSFSPFGSNTRAIVITVDPDRLRAHNLSPEDVVQALGTGNVVVPSGNLYMQGQMPLVPTNAMVADPQELGNIPITPGKNVYIRDVATIQDTHRHQLRLCAGQRPEVGLHSRGEEGHGLDADAWSSEIHESLPLFRSVVPEDVQRPLRVRRIAHGAGGHQERGHRGRDRRRADGPDDPALPPRRAHAWSWCCSTSRLALTASLVGLWLTGNTINIMSLGGLALAIGILVDEAMVTVENTHAQMHHTHSLARAARRADAATAAARFLAMLCILSVFIPTFIMQRAGPLAVHAADAGGGLLDDRLLPALQHARARALGLADEAPGGEAAAKQGLLRPHSAALRQARGSDRAASAGSWCRPTWSVCGLLLVAGGPAGGHRAVSRRWMPASSCSASARRPAPNTS